MNGIGSQGQNGNGHQQAALLTANQNMNNQVNMIDNKLYQDYNLQMQKMKSQKEVDEMDFDEDEEDGDQKWKLCLEFRPVI